MKKIFLLYVKIIIIIILHKSTVVNIFYISKLLPTRAICDKMLKKSYVTKQRGKTDETDRIRF